MTRRASPEEFDEEPPLFASIDSARSKGHRAGEAAAEKAERLDAGWKDAALAAVQEYSRTHDRYLAEHLNLTVPQGADRRALGPVMKEAERLGWIRADGFGPAVSSHGSPKTAWKSLIFVGRQSA